MNFLRVLRDLGVFVLNLAFMPCLVYAAEPDTPSMGRLLIGLVFMIVLIFVGAWLIRRAPQIGAHGAVKVIASASVGTRERVVLLQVGKQQILVGVTAAQITHLLTLSDTIELPASAPLSFHEALHKVLKGQSKQ